MKRAMLSSTDAEYEAATEAGKTIEWVRGLLGELGFPPDGPTPLYQDNKSTMTLATRPGEFRRSKQNLLRYAYVRQLEAERVIRMVWVAGDDMTADIFTKPLTGEAFRRHRAGLGLE
jgi:hypothetical protein